MAVPGILITDVKSSDPILHIELTIFLPDSELLFESIVNIFGCCNKTLVRAKVVTYV